MKGGGTLAALVVLAILAGVLLSWIRPHDRPEGTPTPEIAGPEDYLERVIGLPFESRPESQVASPDDLLSEVASSLDSRFGPGGLTHRARVYELLELAPPGADLRSEMIAAETAGIRGWFNPRSGDILVPADFSEDSPHDQVAWHGLLTEALLHQHAPMSIGPLTDDEALARRSVYQAIAGTVESRLRESNPEPFRIPQPWETEREATILGLSTILHHTEQLYGSAGQARIFVESRLATGARALPELVRNPPRSTFEILGGDPALLSTPAIPPLETVLLEESLGAFPVQVLVEWLEDYEQARTLALLWRGDRYRLYANEWGDNLVWLCNWHSEAAARRASEVFALLGQDTPASPAETRHLEVQVLGTRTAVLNCASEASLEALRNALAIPGSLPEPAP